MDSLTHIAFGACIGEAFFEKGFGKKAMLWGALAQSIPDIDFVAGFWMDTPGSLIAHRGITHSVLFALALAPLLAALAERIHRPHNISGRKWWLFFLVELCVHLFLDVFNNYGIGWLEPFSHHRFSFNAIYVADPFFSLVPAIALVLLLWLNPYHRKRTTLWKLGVFVPVFYLLYCSYNKLTIDREVRTAFRQQGISYTRYFTTPAPLQNWLWYVVAGSDSGYFVGYRSLFDSGSRVQLQFFPRNDQLLDPVSDHAEVSRLIQFSQQFYTVEKWGDTLVFNDLRFGQIIGWENPKEKFVFHYFLQHPSDNNMVVQRGRFTGWNRSTFYRLLRRIAGHAP